MPIVDYVSGGTLMIESRIELVTHIPRQVTGSEKVNLIFNNIHAQLNFTKLADAINLTNVLVSSLFDSKLVST